MTKKTPLTVLEESEAKKESNSALCCPTLAADLGSVRFCSVVVWETPRVSKPLQCLSVPQTATCWSVSHQTMMVDQIHHLLCTYIAWTEVFN